MKIKMTPLSSCPYCYSNNIVGEEMNFEGLSRRVICNNCNRHWDQIFAFDGIEIPDQFSKDIDSSVKGVTS